jgi:hypothetical protein
MTVIKRSRQDSATDLIAAIETLIPLLEDQDEGEAAKALAAANAQLQKAKAGSSEYKAAIAAIVDAFEGEHELMAYTFQRDNAAGQWTAAEVLSQASARVLSLARRINQ